MGSEYQALIVHSKKRRTDYHKGKHSHPNKLNKNRTKFRCFICDEKGHYVRECPKNKNISHKKKGNKRRHHTHATEDDEPSTKRIRQESDEEYVLISALVGNITHGSNDWLIDNGASKTMTRFKESFVKLSEHESPHKVKLGDDYQYPI